VDPALAESLFEPFVSGKAEGMGIGLSVSRGIVESHGGRIWAEAAADGGAVFRFTLPRAAEAAA
jgi:two-component system sensor kinase FixL